MSFREVVEHPGAVAILAVDGRQNVVLVRQYRQPARSILLEVPAGKLEPGEDPLLCAQRELAEETGLQGANWRLLGRVFLSPGFCDERIHIFMTEELSNAEPMITDEDETVETLFVPLVKAYGMIREGEIFDAKTIVALHLASASTA